VRFVALISADAERARRWLSLPAAEREAQDATIRDWFERHAAAGVIESGHELAYPRDAITVRGGRAVEIGGSEAGPALLSGVFVIETETREQAIELAAGWPELSAAGDAVTLYPVHTYDA
jgi:hypothetical protein